MRSEQHTRFWNFYQENGACQGRNLALTVLLVPISPGRMLRGVRGAVLALVVRLKDTNLSAEFADHWFRRLAEPFSSGGGRGWPLPSQKGTLYKVFGTFT